MHKSTQDIRQEQEALLAQMAQTRVMRRGSISRQEYAERRARKGGKGASGPYFVWQGYREGRHFSQRVSGERAEQMRQEIEARKAFERLCAKYIGLSEILAERQGTQASQAAVKKGLKSRSSRAWKSSG